MFKMKKLIMNLN